MDSGDICLISHCKISAAWEAIQQGTSFWGLDKRVLLKDVAEHPKVDIESPEHDFF